MLHLAFRLTDDKKFVLSSLGPNTEDRLFDFGKSRIVGLHILAFNVGEQILCFVRIKLHHDPTLGRDPGTA